MSDTILALAATGSSLASAGTAGTARALPFDSMSEHALTDWFVDQRVTVARGPSEELADVDAQALDDARATGVSMLPDAAQRTALAAVHAAAFGPTTTTWNSRRGAPASVDGVLRVDRSLAGTALADDFIRTRWTTLMPVLGADPDDVLQYALTSQTSDGTEDLVHYKRTRGGSDVDGNGIVVRVSTPSHRYGAGLVLGLVTLWDRAASLVPAGARSIDEVAARSVASATLGVDVRGVAGTAYRVVECISASSGSDCKLVWRVTWNEVPRSAPQSEADTVVVDAVTSDVVRKSISRAYYTGDVDMTSNFPYDGADTHRDYSRGRLYANGLYTNLDTYGHYNWNPGSTSAIVGLDSYNGSSPTHDVRHEFAQSCSPTIADFWLGLTLGTSPTISFGADPGYGTRTDALAFGWYRWGFQVVEALNNFVEGPDTVYYDAAPGGGGGNTAACNWTNGVFAIGFSTDDSLWATTFVRETAMHEFTHPITDCTRLWGPGCADIPSVPREPWSYAVIEGFPESMQPWWNRYESNGSGIAYYRYWKFNGPHVNGDALIYDDEVQGTQTFGSGCGNGPTYVCAANEACWDQAHDHGRCMFRGTSPADCIANHPGAWASQPYVYVDGAGRDGSGGTGISICRSDGHIDGALAFSSLFVQLAHTGGFISGVGPFLNTLRYYTDYSELTATSENFQTYMNVSGPDYEITRAFHSFSTEAFPYLDDATNSWTYGEVLRPARTSQLVFSNGGASGTPLGFQYATDADWFLVPVSPSSTWKIDATTASTSIDLCVGVFRADTGALVATSSGCTDGTSNRNATAQFATGTADRLIVQVTNVLGLSATGYDFRVTNVSDDYPDALTSAFMAEPLLPGGIQVSGTLNTTTDQDLFRYDRPGTSGTASLSFTLGGGVSPAPTLQVYYTTGTTLPSGSPLVTGTGTVTVPSPSVGHYYLRVVSTGGTGAYTVQANTGTCTFCSGTGSYSYPLSLPTTTGGFVWDRLDTASGNMYTDWSNCQNGISCDWYSISLSANERFSASLYGVFDDLCSLEMAIYAPEEQNYFLGATTDRYPSVIDQGGSMSDWGASTEFIAPRAGLYRIRVRATNLDCPKYMLAVARGAVDGSSAVPPLPH